MKVIVDFTLIPIGAGISLSPSVAACEKILSGSGLKTQLHANGTNIEGEWDAVFEAIRQCHNKVHAMGAARISSTIKADTRTDRLQTMEEKVKSVEQKLGEN